MTTNREYKILIVDDEPKNIQLVSSILGVVKNYKLAYATDAQKAMEMIRKDSFNLLLLDIMMPEMDGFELAEILKKHPKTQNIPVIFLTALDNNKSIDKGFKLGAVDYITKPIKKLELVSRVKTIFTFHEHNEQIEELKNEIKFLKRINKITIDSQETPIIFHDDKQIISCNKYLLKLLAYENLEKFLEKNSYMKDLIYDSNCLALQLKDIEWLEKLLKSDETNRISLKTPIGLKHYVVNVTKLNDYNIVQYIIFLRDMEKPKFIFNQGNEYERKI